VEQRPVVVVVAAAAAAAAVPGIVDQVVVRKVGLAEISTSQMGSWIGASLVTLQVVKLEMKVHSCLLDLPSSTGGKDW